MKPNIFKLWNWWQQFKLPQLPNIIHTVKCIEWSWFFWAIILIGMIVFLLSEAANDTGGTQLTSKYLQHVERSISK